MSITILRRDELSADAFVREWQGGEIPASAIFVDAAPGDRVRLHRHPYAELFFVIEGTSTFEDGETAFEVEAGSLIVVPPRQPHAFSNRSDSVVRQIDVHLSGTFDTEWLED